MKISLFCLDVVGRSMAGPAIRYWEFAKALSKFHEVILLTPNKCDRAPEGFQIIQSRKLPDGTDIVIAQEVSHRNGPSGKAKKHQDHFRCL